MGKGQFITKKEAEMLLERQRAKRKGQNDNYEVFIKSQRTIIMKINNN